MNSVNTTSAPWQKTSESSFGRYFWPLEENQGKTNAGWEYRWGVGKTANPPRVIDEVRKPYKSIFLHFPDPNTTVKLNEKINYVTTLYIYKVKITNIGGAPDVVFLEFVDSTDAIRVDYIHNLNISSSVLPINRVGATTVEDYSNGKVLVNFRSAKTLSNIKIKLIDINGDDVSFDDIYLWLEVETMLW